MTDRSREAAAWELSVIDDPPIVRIVVTGHFNLELWLRAMSEIPRTPGFRPGMSSLIDAREAIFDLSQDDIRELVKQVGEHVDRRGGGRFRSAYVASDDLSYGLNRMLQAMAEDKLFEFGVFRSIDEALGWLRQAPPPP